MASAAVPAWKRLGLKLKYAEQDAPDSGDGIHRDGGLGETEVNHSLSQVQAEPSPPLRKKRKIDKHEAKTTHTTDANKLSSQKSASALDNDQVDSMRPKKQVSFSSDTKPLDPSEHQLPPTDSAGLKKPKAKSKTKVKGKSVKAQHSEQRSHPVLEYLNQYHTARTSWKFNKNRETWLLKHIFSVADVPRAYEMPLARYIHGLQGENARERLRSGSEKQLKSENGSTNGETSSQQDSKNSDEYRMRFLRDLESRQDAQEGVDQQDEYSDWIQHQSRAKLLLWALGSPLPSTTTGEGSSALNNQGKKRKNRTTVIDYDSSSSSSSSSDSDGDDDSTSSDDTSSEEDDTSSSGEDSSDG